MKKYSSIEQLRSVVREVKSNHDFQGKDENGDAIYNHSSPYPTLKFEGTVKVHGTNASIIRTVEGEKIFQSRNRVLSLDKDNAQFMISMMGKNLDFLFSFFPPGLEVILYGEWCGDNIQKGVAITGLPKMFIIFDVMVDGELVEMPKGLQNNEQNIYNILQFQTYEVDINFNTPELVQNKLIEDTLAVEKECPVGKFFGVSGIGEVFCISLYYNSLVVVATPTNKTRFPFSWMISVVELLVSDNVEKLTPQELNKIRPHLTKKMLQYDMD